MMKIRKLGNLMFHFFLIDEIMPFFIKILLFNFYRTTVYVGLSTGNCKFSRKFMFGGIRFQQISYGKK